MVWDNLKEGGNARTEAEEIEMWNWGITDPVFFPLHSSNLSVKILEEFIFLKKGGLMY